MALAMHHVIVEANMHRFTLLAVVAAASLAAGCFGTVGYSAGVSSGGGGPDLVYAAPGVQVIADYNEPIFFSDSLYWRFDGVRWYRSSYYTGAGSTRRRHRPCGGSSGHTISCTTVRRAGSPAALPSRTRSPVIIADKRRRSNGDRRRTHLRRRAQLRPRTRLRHRAQLRHHTQLRRNTTALPRRTVAVTALPRRTRIGTRSRDE
jgi:hypothetical protein